MVGLGSYTEKSLVGGKEKHLRNRCFSMGAGKHQSRSGAEAVDAKERIVIVTGVPTAPCTNPYGDYLLSLSMQNKQDYARLHSYEVHLMAEAVTSHIRAGPWQKVGFIQKVRGFIFIIRSYYSCWVHAMPA